MFEPVLLRNIDVPDGHLLSTYEAGGGYRALRKALGEYTPDEIVELVKESNLRGRGGCRVPDGHEVELRAESGRQAEIPLLQCR